MSASGPSGPLVILRYTKVVYLRTKTIQRQPYTTCCSDNCIQSAANISIRPRVEHYICIHVHTPFFAILHDRKNVFNFGVIFFSLHIQGWWLCFFFKYYDTKVQTKSANLDQKYSDQDLQYLLLYCYLLLSSQDNFQTILQGVVTLPCSLF